MSGEIGYLSVAAADLYFSTRLFSDAWTSIPADSNSVKKIAALTTAYDRLYYSGLFDLPTLAAAPADELVVLQKAQCELSLYLLQHLADEDRRKGLQAQGVTAAGIVKETYGGGAGGSADVLDTLPIPPIVAKMLEDFSIAGSGFEVSSIDRDEDEDGMKL
jgi:hypothetical protein